MHILCSVPGLTDLGRGIAASYVYLEKCFPMCSWAANEVTRGPFSLRARACVSLSDLDLEACCREADKRSEEGDCNGQRVSNPKKSGSLNWWLNTQWRGTVLGS